MAKIKYDVSNVEDVSFEQPKPGVYRAKIASVDGPKDSSQGNSMLEVVLEITDKKYRGAKLWHYPILNHDSPFVKARLKEFVQATGMKLKGTLDTDSLTGKIVQVQVKSDKNLDGDYRAKVGKLMAVPSEEEEEAEEEETVPSEEEEEAEEEETVPSEEEEEEIDNGPGDSGDDEEEDDYDDWPIQELKDELKGRALRTAGKKSALIDRLRKDDGEEGGDPF